MLNLRCLIFGVTHLDAAKRVRFSRCRAKAGDCALPADCVSQCAGPLTLRLLMSYIYRVSQEECAILRESVPYVKLYRYNPKHLYPKLNGYGDNDQRKVGTSCISAYCTSRAVPRIDLDRAMQYASLYCTSSAQRDKIVLHYCQIFMRYVQCLVTLKTTKT